MHKPAHIKLRPIQTVKNDRSLIKCWEDKMKKLILFIISISVLGCTTVPKVTNRQELDAHADAMLRYGVKDKDECASWYQMAGCEITADAIEPIDTIAIDEYYKKLSSKDPYSEIRLLYNRKLVNREKYQFLKLQKAEQLYLENLARLQALQSLQQANESLQRTFQAQQESNARVLSAFQNRSTYIPTSTRTISTPATISSQPFSLTPTLKVKDSYGRTQQTIKKNPYALNETYDIYENGRKVGKYEKQPFSINETWKLKDASGKTVSSTTEQPFSLNKTWKTTDPSGQLKCKTKEQPFSLTPTYKTYDSTGNELNTIKKKPFSLYDTWEVK